MEFFEPGDHHCDDCEVKGHCSIEIFARWAMGNDERLRETEEIVGKLQEGWLQCLMMDFPTEPMKAMACAILTGISIGRGAEIVETTPDTSMVLSKLLHSLIRNAQDKVEEEKEERIEGSNN